MVANKEKIAKTLKKLIKPIVQETVRNYLSDPKNLEKIIQKAILSEGFMSNLIFEAQRSVGHFAHAPQQVVYANPQQMVAPQPVAPPPEMSLSEMNAYLSSGGNTSGRRTIPSELREQLSQGKNDLGTMFEQPEPAKKETSRAARKLTAEEREYSPLRNRNPDDEGISLDYMKSLGLI